MIAVAAIARRSSEVFLFEKGFAMHGFLILFKLIGGYVVFGHVYRVSVACSACLGNVHRICARVWNAGVPNFMYRMTGDTICNLGILHPEQPLSVDRRLVLLKLVSWK